jgi:spermidine synthase
LNFSPTEPSNDVTFSEEAGIRYLHFGSHWVQGAMRLSSPNALELSYVKDMMAWLLFLAPPLNIVQLGLGAASLTKFSLAYCKPSHVTAVELDKTVILATQAWFKLRHDHPRLTVVHADAEKYLNQAHPHQYPNVLQVDVYDAKARGPVLDSPSFYSECFRSMGGHLGVAGVAVFNFFGSDHFIRSRERVAKVFGGKIVQLPACKEGNIVLLAFCGPDLNLRLDDLSARANLLETKFKLPARHWLQAIQSPANRWLLSPLN